ncbi:MAG TPA: glycosyltransferase family 39 protein [Candidatus Angelobacter sp.]|nr:glycosyltransferase family 39 protein [Candidatus Angelobacter sp.]
MQMQTLLQEAIHKLESAWALRYLKILVFVLATAVVLIRYDVHCARNMSAPAAMDSAQLARNISEGHGYTTEFIRPLSIYLVKQQHHTAGDKDPARLNQDHPDLANAPVYPVVLAGLMKVLPFHFETSLKGVFWSTPDINSPGGRRGLRYQPDFLITFFNQFLFGVLLVMVFFWARRLFDFSVARLSVILLLGTEVLWRFSASGLSTTLLMVIFMGVIWCLTLWESEVREPKGGPNKLLLLSVAVGALTGIGGLTRYSFLCMIIPVVIFLGVYGGPRRLVYCASALVVFGLIAGPWIARNYAASGTAFGTSGYNVVEWFFPGFRLQRSLAPDLPGFPLILYFRKLTTNLLPVLQDDLFDMAGGWIAGFFLVSLMVGFRNPGLRRLRYFIVASVAMLAMAQALSRTKLWDETPLINSENLLVLLAPMIVVYGVGLFYTLLEGIQLPFPEMRFVAIWVFAILIMLPMWFALLLPGKGAIVYPPYWPDKIQQGAHLFSQDEMMMSDVPWAVAWYGDRQTVWLTLNATADPKNPTEWQESFFAINDALKPIDGLLLTPRSMDGHFQTDLLFDGHLSWGHFILGTVTSGEVPNGFPLRKAFPGWMPNQLLLCDRVRW